MFWRNTQSNKISFLGKFSITNYALIKVLKEKDNSTLFAIFPDLFQAWKLLGKFQDFSGLQVSVQTLTKLWYFFSIFSHTYLTSFPARFKMFFPLFPERIIGALHFDSFTLGKLKLLLTILQSNNSCFNMIIFVIITIQNIIKPKRTTYLCLTTNYFKLCPLCRINLLAFMAVQSKVIIKQIYQRQCNVPRENESARIGLNLTSSDEFAALCAPS